MDQAAKDALKKKMDDTLLELTALEQKRQALTKELKEMFPIKDGEKVEIWETGLKGKEDRFDRFAYLNNITINHIQRNQEAHIGFNLQKCKANGEKSQHSDYLGYGEYVKKIW